MNNLMRARVTAVIMGMFFLAMLMTSLIYRFSHTDLTMRRITPRVQAEDDAAGAMSAIGALMRHVGDNPGDKGAILRLVESLMAIGQFDSAENFAQKALALDPAENQDPKTLYLLALVHHNKGRNDQAAELLEKILEKSENPSARFSLGILYLHFLDSPEKGIAQLEKGLASGKASPALARAMEDELKKARGNSAAATDPASTLDK